MSERPRWRVNQQSFVGHALVEEGAEVFYTPNETAADDPRVPGVAENLSPLNDAAQDIVDAQTDDHPDKTKHAEAKHAATAKKAAAKKAAEGDLDDGLVPPAQKSGETQTPAERRAAKKAKDGPKPDATGKNVKGDVTAKDGKLDITPAPGEEEDDIG